MPSDKSHKETFVKAKNLLENYESKVIIGKRTDEQISLAYLYYLIRELDARITALE